MLFRTVMKEEEIARFIKNEVELLGNTTAVPLVYENGKILDRRLRSSGVLRLRRSKIGISDLRLVRGGIEIEIVGDMKYKHVTELTREYGNFIVVTPGNTMEIRG